MHASIEFLIEKVDFGVAAHFAKRVGIGKPCLHSWRKNKSAITLEGALKVCAFTGFDAASFFEGQTHKWVKGQVLEQQKFDTKSEFSPEFPNPVLMESRG